MKSKCEHKFKESREGYKFMNHTKGLYTACASWSELSIARTEVIAEQF